MLERSAGLIDGCEHACCGRRCCDFSGGNFIVLYPGELNEATAAGAPLAHLAVRPSDDGGHRAICHAGDTATCDGGYKPLDCASYPYFPTLDDDGATVHSGLHSSKCPLARESLHAHADWVTAQWQELAEGSAAVRRWLRSVLLVGYNKVRRRQPTRASVDGGQPSELTTTP